MSEMGMTLNHKIMTFVGGHLGENEVEGEEEEGVD